MKHSVLSRFLLCVVFAICVLIVAAIASKSTKITNPQATQNQEIQTPVVVNETDAFQVESLTSEITRPNSREMLYVLKLKNVSAKKITAYVIEHPSRVTQYPDFAGSGGGVAPGSVEKVEIYDIVQPATLAQPNKITIKLAVFEDGSSEGDFKDHRRIMDMRLGTKIGFERISNILQEALRLKRGEARESETSKKQWLEQIISDISELPDKSPPGQSFEVGSGFHYVKEMTLNSLKALNEWQVANQSDSIKARGILESRGEIAGTRDLPDGVTRIIRFNETLINRYKEALNEK